MSKKFYTLLAIFALAAVILSACGNGGEETADCTSEEVLCIGLVTDVGEVDDKSFNQSAWEGVQEVAEKHGAQIEYVETKDAKDYATNIGLFLADGYDIIVTVGFGLGEATAIAAADNPDTYFIGVDQFQVWHFDDDESNDLTNYVGLVFHEDHSGFLSGALAAMLTESGVIAGVYGTDLVPPVVAFKEGYEAGAAYIDPEVEVISTYHPGGMDVAFTDPEWGAATAAQAIDLGADVIFGAGGKTGNGAIIETAGVEGLWCIGVDADQWFSVPEAHPCLVTSAMKLITPGIVDIVDLFVAGEAPSANFFGAAGLAPFHDHDAAISDEIKAQLDDIAAGLLDGSITTGYGE